MSSELHLVEPMKVLSFLEVKVCQSFSHDMIQRMLIIISEGYVSIFHKDNGQLIEKLEGHEKGCCSSVSWNPTNPCMFASAGDDRKVRM